MEKIADKGFRANPKALQRLILGESIIKKKFISGNFTLKRSKVLFKFVTKFQEWSATLTVASVHKYYFDVKYMVSYFF